MTAAASDMDLINLTAPTAVALMRSGELSAERYVQALLDRAEQFRRLNAFRTLPRDSVLEAARAADTARRSGAASGLLHGLPLPVKDSINTCESPTSKRRQSA
jgi:indoleacetamide hydrolase